MVNRRVGVYTSDDGLEMVSPLESFAVWKLIGITEPRYDQHGVCLYCGGSHEVRDKTFGRMWCICEVSKYTRRLVDQYRDIHSIAGEVDIDDMELWGSPAAQKYLNDTRRDIKSWMKWPDGWITVIGNPGSGKTHILMSIQHEFGPWAVYVTSNDFELKIGSLLDNPEEGGMTVSEYLESLITAPILLLDDLGSEYNRPGRDWTRSNLRKVIDARYNARLAFPTVVATNLRDADLRAYDMRIADRILDESLVQVFRLLNGSYRTGRNANANK